MIKLFSKGASFLLQAIIVIAGVLIFAWFDPFDIFSPTKNTLKNTPIQVESIKEIGKLITAEYYGEAIASLDEVIEKELATVIINFSDTIDYINDHFEDAIAELQEQKKLPKKQNAFNVFYKNNPKLIKTELFEVYLKFAFDELSKFNSFKFNDFDEELSPNQKEKLFRKLHKQKWKTATLTNRLPILNAVFNKIETKKGLEKNNALAIARDIYVKEI